jgi:L-ascorbate metabolism protein UlaG (beta-lactamase superfamily)
MEVTWYGRTCIRLRGKDAVVVTDPYQAVVGPTGRGITGDVVTISHPDDTPLRKAKGTASRDGLTLLPSSLEAAFVLDGPGEYEVKDVLLTGVRTYRDDARGEEHGKSVSFAVEIDGIRVMHLGDIGHLLSEEKLGDIGSVDIACVPLTRHARLARYLHSRDIEFSAQAHARLKVIHREYIGGSARSSPPRTKGANRRNTSPMYSR